MLTAQANETIVVTAVYKTFFTRTTRAVVDDGLYTYPVSDSKAVRYTFSHLFDRA
jgi:hypothetical protein